MGDKGLGAGTQRYQDTITALKKCSVVEDLGKASAVLLGKLTGARLAYLSMPRPPVPVLTLCLAHTQSCPCKYHLCLAYAPQGIQVPPEGWFVPVISLLSTSDFGTSLPHHCHVTPPGWPGSPSLAEVAV